MAGANDCPRCPPGYRPQPTRITVSDMIVDNLPILVLIVLLGFGYLLWSVAGHTAVGGFIGGFVIVTLMRMGGR